MLSHAPTIPTQQINYPATRATHTREFRQTCAVAYLRHNIVQQSFVLDIQRHTADSIALVNNLHKLVMLQTV